MLFEVSYKCPHWPFICPKELFDYYGAIVEPPKHAFPEDAPPKLRSRAERDKEGIRGRSMLPLVEKDAARVIFSELWESNTFMALRGDLKYVDYKDGMCMLFDLAGDPDELQNLADDPRYATAKAELRQALDELPEAWRAGHPGWVAPGR